MRGREFEPHKAGIERRARRGVWHYWDSGQWLAGRLNGLELALPACEREGDLLCATAGAQSCATMHPICVNPKAETAGIPMREIIGNSGTVPGMLSAKPRAAEHD